MSFYFEKLVLPSFWQISPPNFVKAGLKLDTIIKRRYTGQDILIRCISSADHPGKSSIELVETIRETGSDRYDPYHKNFWQGWKVYENTDFDFFATKKRVENDFTFGTKMFELFYEGALADRGYRVLVDIIMIYEFQKFDCVPIYFSETEIEEVWKFKNPNRKREALIGIIHIID